MYSRPHVDDFMIASLSADFNLIDALKYWYLNWTGRYSSTVLLLGFLNPLRYNAPFLYSYFITGTILIELIISFVFIKFVFNDHSRELQVFLWLILSAFYFAFIPGLSDGVYWMAGNFTYFTSIILMLLFCILLIKILRGQISLWLFVTTCCTAIFLIGINELILLVVLFSVFFILLYSYLNENTNFRLLFILLLIVMVFSALSIMSPGNSIRSSELDNERQNNLFNAVYSSFALGFFHFRHLIVQTPLLLLLVSSGVFMANKIKHIYKFYSTSKFSFLLPIGAWSLYIVTFFPGAWVMLGNYSRTLNVSYFIGMISFVVTISYSIFKMQSFRRFLEMLASFKNIYIFLLILNGACFWFYRSDNLNLVYKDLTYNTAKNYSIEINDRIKKLERLKNSEIVTLDSLRNKPMSIYPESLAGDGLGHIDSNYRIYYKIKKIEFK
jgi:hypothetical protein